MYQGLLANLSIIRSRNCASDMPVTCTSEACSPLPKLASFRTNAC